MPDSRSVKGYAISVGLACAGAGIALWSQMPLPWFLGPMFANAIAALCGMPLKGLFFLRPVAMPVLGVMLGSSFSPHVFGDVERWLFAVGMIPVYAAVGAILAYVYFRVVARYDAITAYFASVPGGFTEMIILGESYGANPAKVALAQSMRLLFVVSGIAVIFAVFLGVSRGTAQAGVIGWADVGVRDGVLLAVCAVFGSFAGRHMRLPVPDMIGPLILSAVLHLTSSVAIGPPTLLTILAQVILGSGVGARFAGMKLRSAAMDLCHAMAGAALLLATSAGIAVLILAVVGVTFFQGLLAFSPGGMMEMSLLSLAIGESVAFVTVIHAVRFAFVVTSAPLVARILFRSHRRGTAPPPVGDTTTSSAKT